MLLYRIAKTDERCRDLSGFGAYKYGGRWNSPGTYMLYTSEYSSLAYLESLVHFEPENFPPALYIATMDLAVDERLIYTFPHKNYPADWQKIGSTHITKIGDDWMRSRKYAAVKVRSAINSMEFNYLINPLFDGYHKLLKVVNISQLNIDSRLIK